METIEKDKLMIKASIEEFMEKAILLILILLISGCKDLSKYDYACNKCDYNRTTDYKKETLFFDRIKIECDGNKYIEIYIGDIPIHNKWGDTIRYEENEDIMCKLFYW